MTRPHVRSGASTLGLPIDSLGFAYAMFCPRAHFDEHQAATGESSDYDAMPGRGFNQRIIR